jgi:hypothetical protein
LGAFLADKISVGTSEAEESKERRGLSDLRFKCPAEIPKIDDGGTLQNELPRSRRLLLLVPFKHEPILRCHKRNRYSRPHQKRGYLRRFVLGWRGFAVFSVLLGTAAAAYSLRPLIAVTASPSLNKGAPYEPILTITNNGLTELYDLKFNCTVNVKYFAATSGTRDFHVQDDSNGEVGNHIKNERVLPPQTSIARTCATSVGISDVKIVSVSMAMRIHFRLWYWPDWLSKLVRFKARTDPSGQVQRFPEPNAEPGEVLP